MVEDQTPLGKMYATFKQTVLQGTPAPIMALVNQELAKASPNNEVESIRGHFKMFVSLIFGSLMLIVNHH